MPWAVAAAGVTAAAGLAGSAMQSSAASKGQAQAQRQFEQQRNDLGPYREAGLAPLAAQQNLLGLNGQPAADAAMAQFQQSPGYAFQFDEGMRALEAGQAASGMLRSGATLKREMEFGQGLANQDFGNYYNRLMDLSKMGQNSAAGGATTAGQSAEAALNGANAQSSIYGNTASSIGTAANALFNNKGFQNWLSGPSAGTTMNPSSYQTSPGLAFQAPNAPYIGSGY